MIDQISMEPMSHMNAVVSKPVGVFTPRVGLMETELSQDQPLYHAKLKRPLGPLSKPNRGGYSLKHALDWEPGVYKTIQVGHPHLFKNGAHLPWRVQHNLHTMCHEHLNIKLKSYEKQSTNAKIKFRAKASTSLDHRPIPYTLVAYLIMYEGSRKISHPR